MKVLQSSVFRALCAIVTGILLVNNPDSTVRGITIAIGAMFLVSGVISCATYFSALNHAKDVEVYDDKGTGKTAGFIKRKVKRKEIESYAAEAACAADSCGKPGQTHDSGRYL